MAGASVQDVESIRWLPLSAGLPTGIVVVSILFCAVSIMLVTIRMAVKLRDRTFGWDDALLAIGTGFYVPDVFMACLATYRGLGHMNVDLVNAFLQVESMKWYYLWIIFYVVALLFVKTSICLTILRITGTNRKYRIAVWTLIVCSVISFLVVFFGLMFYCLPMKGVWDSSLVLSGEAKCASISTLIALSYASTAGTIITDLGCAVLPAVILYQTQMRLEQKIAVGALLSFASAASITTIIRTPYIDRYNNPTDNLMFWVGHISLFSNVETGIGCIATSLPQLRALWIRRHRGSQEDSRSQPRSKGNSHGIVTIGSMPLGGRKRTRHTQDAGETLATVYAQGDGDWEHLDGSSDKGLDPSGRGGIYTEYTFAVEMSDAPKHRGGSVASDDKDCARHA